MHHKSLRILLPNSLLMLGLLALVTGCKDVSATLPAGTPDPAVYNTPAGAIEKRNTVYSVFEDAFQKYSRNTAFITDENGGGINATPDPLGSLDQRYLPESGVDFVNINYAVLQSVRARAAEAIGTLAKYDTVHSPALRGEMYALEGYAEVMLAELFCSGIPLSTYDFEADFTYKPGSTQQQVYQDAIAKFDTALALSTDSVRFLNLARIGMGRAYLDLGDYPHAAAVVAAVPDEFLYQINLPWGNGEPMRYYASDGAPEGINGLPFRSDGDPRTRDIAAGFNTFTGEQLYWPMKYVSALSVPYYSFMTLADGVEARLIQAEAALQLHPNDPNWLTTLNALRSAYVADPNANSLAPLTDPGATLSGTAAINARVDLLFHERAYWLYLTGHRQGDLRRLVRNYHRDQSTVYPTGPYGVNGRYGSDVTVPIPATEDPNPYFHGCLDRNA